MISSIRITFPFLCADLVRIVVFYFVLYNLLPQIQATDHHQSETKTNFDESLQKDDGVTQDKFHPTPFFKKRPPHIQRWGDFLPNTHGRTSRYFNVQNHYFTLKSVGLEDGSIGIDSWKGNCPNAMPLFIKPFNISALTEGSREKMIKVVLHKRKERTNKNVCIDNTCCIFSNIVSMELLITWFVKGYNFFSSDDLCCKISVLCLDEHLSGNNIGYDLNVYIKAVEKIDLDEKFGHIKVNLYNVLDEDASDFNHASIRERRDISTFNSTRDFNTTEEFHQISIQNNIDASWGIVCVFTVVILVVVIGCALKMFDMKQNTKVHFSYHDGIHLMYVNDLVRRKARLLPMFQSAWRQSDEETIFVRGKKGDSVPFASVVEEDEENQIENYNEDEQYLD